MTAFDPYEIRKSFPILDKSVYGKPLVYFDNAASTQTHDEVLEAMTNAAHTGYGNVHRGLHYMSNQATENFENARNVMQKYLNAPRREEIIFTSGGTDGFNLIAHALSHAAIGDKPVIGEGDEILLSVMEHHSNIVPWHLIRERFGATMSWIDIDAHGSIDLDAFRKQFTPKTKLVTITQLSNTLGVKPPIKEMIKIAHEHGALVVVDGCQGAVHGPVDVQDLNADFYVMTGHKLYGPNGIGVVYGRYELLATLPPFKGGGEMIDIVERDHITYNEPPHRFEAGTPPILEAIGLGAAASWMMDQNIAALQSHEMGLYDQAYQALSDLDFIDIYGHDPAWHLQDVMAKKGAVLSFNMKGAHPHDVSTILDRSGVAIRAGHHCCQPLMKQLGIIGTNRASFAAYNTTEEIEPFIRALIKAYDMLG